MGLRSGWALSWLALLACGSEDAAKPAAPAAPRCAADADFQSDAENCGSCGHSCRGAACSAGMCAATKLYQATDGTREATGLAVQGESVYFSDYSSRVYQVPATGGAATLLLVEMNFGSCYPAGMVMSEGTLFWACDGDGVVRSYVPGQAEALEIGELDGAWRLSVGDGEPNVYAVSLSGNLAAIPRAGGTATELATATGRTGYLVADGDYAIWNGQDAVMRLNKATNVVDALVSGVGEVYPLTIHAGHAYYGAGAPRTLYSVPLAGGTSEAIELGAPQAPYWGLAVDDEYYYWAGNVGIWRKSRGDEPAQQLAPTYDISHYLTLSGDFLYWAEGNTTTGDDPYVIMRTPAR